MHRVLINRFGGSHGLRDLHGLESAVARPRQGYYADIVSEAAALMESLAVNHPFVDGNKRIAFAAADVFFRLNGWRIECPAEEIYREMMKMFEDGEFDLAHLEPWLRSITKEVYRPTAG